MTAPIYFGGGAVPDEDLARELGADGWSGADAASVIAAVEGITTTSHQER